MRLAKSADSISPNLTHVQGRDYDFWELGTLVERRVRKAVNVASRVVRLVQIVWLLTPIGGT